MRIAAVTALCIAGLTATQATAQDWAVEYYGGGSFEGSLGVDATDQDVDSGTEFGGAIYHSGLYNGLELGLDLSLAERDYSVSGDSMQTTSALAMARYNFYDNGSLSAYGGLGLGWLQTEVAGDSDSGLGGRVALGVRYDVNEAVGFFGEVRHTRAFDNATLNGVSGIQDHNNSIVVGVRTTF
ncbi:porin family protein [Falsihalocynthiibacter sp. SS001]|uniref:porin family protein n=1 Tax=Falsihalocynthiibacter sp. SS001 TaxID=3349698 RepID=UPI0036D2A9F6